MKREPGFIFRGGLVFGDLVATLGAFIAAYYFRVFVDARPYFFHSGGIEFTRSMLFLLPLWVIIFVLAGLYRASVYQSWTRELGRIFIASILGVMTLISYDYFIEGEALFPGRLILLYALLFLFFALFLERSLLRLGRKLFLRKGIGVTRVVVVGNHPNTRIVINSLKNNMGSGFKVVGAVADKKYLREDEDVAHFEELVLAIRRTHADMIIQTDGEELEATYDMAIKKHLGYMMVPTHDIFLSQRTSLELLGELPAFGVKATTLVGYGRVFKRAFDVVFGVIGLIIASPFMAIIAIIVKISDGGPVLFQQSRLTRFGKMTKVFKFRSMKPKYSGMSPEAAFETMGRPELSIQYRKNGDQLDKDPRVTFFGRFLRKTSLDELPQIFNVLSGKISIVGPRALVPEELKDYADKELILSVKSGMTGLAQVSGRRDISFEERRVLDVFYIQNWSILLDLQIIVKTFWFVLRRRGAK